MRKLIAILLCLCLLTCSASAGFADFTDVQAHWAANYIEQAVTLELFNGTSETTFSPESTMTRGMFVTVLGRIVGIDPANWAMEYGTPLFADVTGSEYYAPYINWAVRNGITNGVGAGKFAPDSPVTREQITTLLLRYAQITGQCFDAAGVMGEDIGFAFSDDAEISEWARAAVYELQESGIITGIANDDGTYHFSPRNPATRAQCATIFCRLLETIMLDETVQLIPVGSVVLDPQTLTVPYQGQGLLTATLYPENASNQTLVWISSDPSVASVEDGIVTWVSAGRCVISVFTNNHCMDSAEVICSANPDLASSAETYTQKCQRIFGQYVSDPRQVYGSSSEALPNMVTITVPVWDVNASGQKYTVNRSLQVHKNIASTVEQIFREIYACPEQYPIKSLGGYRWATMSEHNCGLAIDINPNENYYCSPSGQALVGSFFNPAISEYSIPVGGDIDQIFARYGFRRGIYWNSGYKDYMHYSYFGT